MKNNRKMYTNDVIQHYKRSVLKLGLSLLVFMASLSAQAQAPTKKISITFKEATVEEAINEISRQTDVEFIYNHETVSKAPRVSVTLSQVDLESALDEIFKGTDLTYENVNNTIVIKPKKESVPEKKTIENPGVLKQNVRGQVFDKESKSTLPFATVQILDTDPIRGAVTDMDGNFIIENLPVGRYTLKVSFVGYKDGFVHEFLLGTGKETILQIELTEQLQTLGEIVVTANNNEPLNEMASTSAKSFNAEETKRYAASISDPARMAQVFAGVSGTDDASNEIVIRGNSPNWMLWRLEGVEIPSPNHFAEEGYSSGAVSILSNNMLGSSDFYTGAFPADYGNALSGVFDIRLRNGNNKETEFTLQAGVLGVDVAAEGPFRKGYMGSYLFNYRYATLSLLNNLNIQVSENALPNYQDISFKLNFPTKKAGTFSLWGIGGLSDVDEKYLPDSTESEKFKYGYSDFTKTGMYATGLTHNFFPDKQSYIQTVVSQSMSYSSEDYKTMDAEGILKGKFFDELQNRAIRFSTYYNRKLSSRTSIRVGGILNNLNYSYYSKLFIDSTRTWKKYLDSDGSTNLYQAYAQGKYKFSDKVSLTTGLHYTHFELSNDNSVEPRVGLVVELPKRQKLGLGYGMHSRHENLPVYFAENLLPDGSVYFPNKGLKLTTANHIVASYEKMVGENVNVKTEVYYQHIGNLPVPTNPDKLLAPAFTGLSPDDTLANIGIARNYGLEFTLQKFFSNDYYFLLTSSLFDSKYKPANGSWYNSRYNVNYINNLVGGKEFKWGENKMIGLNAKAIWSGGKRLIPLDLEASIAEGGAVYKTDEVYSIKAKDYFRVDLGARLHIYKTKTQHVFSIDIQNVSNRLNTWAHVYDAEQEKLIDYPMAGLIPILNYRFEF